MWKISRNLVFPRWHVSKQTPVEAKAKKPACHNALVPFVSEKTKHSDESSHGKKKKFHKESKRFWSCDQFQSIFKPMFFETAGWLGAVTVLCFNFHTKYFNSHHEQTKFRCIFSRNVLAMPESIVAKKGVQPTIVLLDKPKFPLIEESQNEECVSESNFLDDLQINTRQYIAALQNSAGFSCSNKNAKKAFRHFQGAARLGSSQGLYNLGLCYELGRGTKINLHRAAFCYRKAAMKGHGLASFNLAVFFLKGLGGLPVDPETAKLLLAEAADKDVPEAQICMGIEFLEEKNWSEAFKVFENLAKKNVLDGKYYLGICYANGWGVNQDEKLAAEIFSQAAALGHSKSILKLSKCYEDGFGNCEPDLDFAEALCQILVDQNDNEGRIALQRLQTKKEALYIKDLLQLKLSNLKLRKDNFHVSSSVPELPANKLLKAKCFPSFTSSYLDLIPPQPVSTNSLQQGGKPSFFIGEEKLNLSLSTTYVPCYQSNIAPVLSAKT
ncbi:hypothetical protein JTE90_002233 [Oedothorax gibbosus]|uniref:Death ligand signal enhancer n=1 Tax=Oedothorax gibbosus TaxID=931172 RepID=A0AAV6V5X3_9ARAC|nr:hypothetical protein JTE90_002233 [Oedothorax gibbosus]